MIDPVRLTIGMVILFGGLFVILTGIAWLMMDRHFWKALGVVAATYAICGALVFFIIGMVAWSYDQTIWEMMFE